MKNVPKTEFINFPQLNIETYVVPAPIIRESEGDVADQAQEQIDVDIREKIYEVRRKIRQAAIDGRYENDDF